MLIDMNDKGGASDKECDPLHSMLVSTFCPESSFLVDK